MLNNHLIELIEKSWELRQNDISFSYDAVNEVLNKLDSGELRVVEKSADQWLVKEWVKKAILLSFKLNDSRLMGDCYYDKVDLKFSSWNEEDFFKAKIRAVPGSVVRKSCYIGNNVVLMPSFVNVGAYIDDGCLIDSWATIGSCAQIGKNCHISGGVGIGGVLEPIQASPVIIEDNCFIGARSEIVEGVVVEEGSVISMGVFIGQSTKIYDKLTKKITYGRIPAYSVVIPGNIASEDGSYSTYAAIIIKKADKQTREKTSINELLRY